MKFFNIAREYFSTYRYITMINPSYTHGIPNAVASIAKFLWDNSRCEYDSHNDLDIYLDREKYDKVVFLLIDWLWYNYIQQQWSGYIYDHMVGKISSTFPSSTSIAHTAWNTGMAAYNHGMTSWDMYLRELGLHIQSIPLKTCVWDTSLADYGIDKNTLFNFPSFFSYFPTKSASIIPQGYIWSMYNTHLFEHGNDLYGYDDTTLDDFFVKIKESAEEESHMYTYAYYPHFDADSHLYGNWSDEVAELYTQLDQKIQTLRSSLDSRTCLMISSDHGFMDQVDDKILVLGDEVLSYLTTPPYGSHRYVYLDVDQREETTFLEYIWWKIEHAGVLKKSQDLIDSWFFGTGNKHTMVEYRVGTYVLLMNDGWVCKYPKPWRVEEKKIWHHGWLSEDEMLCPIVICE